jgi:hypothetical protein
MPRLNRNISLGNKMYWDPEGHFILLVKRHSCVKALKRKFVQQPEPAELQHDGDVGYLLLDDGFLTNLERRATAAFLAGEDHTDGWEFLFKSAPR